MESIPVIGTAIVNGMYWIHRLVATIDYPTDNLVIFDNNGKGELTEELDNLARIKHKYIKKITVTHMPSNIGVSGAWNLIIKSYITAPYWIIVNHDIGFTPGFLQEMVNKASDSEVGMVHGSGGDFGDGGWDLFLIKDWVVQSHGLFDENLYPAYGEDCDYIMRLKVKPIKRVYSVDKLYFHGLGTNYYETGQQTKREDEELSKKLNVVNEVNFEYLTEKWGPGWRNTSPTPFPFNHPDMPLSITTYDLEYVRRKYMGF